MASVIGYINSGGTTTSAVFPQGQWCRPSHKPTCCIGLYGGQTCCLCIPSTATCFIIEMWSQGGGGGGGCCCGVGSYGGQGGTYGWVACTIAGTVQTLCACVCNCSCSTCTICSGTAGQFSRVVNCAGAGQTWCVCGAAAGIWCCNPSAPWCWGGATQNPTPTGIYNTWYFWQNCSSQLAQVYNPSFSVGSVSLNCYTEVCTPGCCLVLCCTSATSITPTAITFTGCAGGTPTTVGTLSSTSGIAQTGAPVNVPIPSVLNNLWGCLCTCSCFSSPYVWMGACGWSDPAAASTPYGCLNATASSIPNAACGGGAGVGGAAYAGGDQAWLKCSFACQSCSVQCGNFPGGGGMSTWSGTAWSSPGCGAPGLILISYC